MTVDYASCDDSCKDPWRYGPHRLDVLFHRYTEGDCGLLAVAISERTGWTIRWLEGGRRNHAVVELPDSRFIDITGTMTWDELLHRWFRNEEPDDSSPWEGDPTENLWFRPIDVQTAQVAEELIALVMTEEMEMAT